MLTDPPPPRRSSDHSVYWQCLDEVLRNEWVELLQVPLVVNDHAAVVCDVDDAVVDDRALKPTREPFIFVLELERSLAHELVRRAEQGHEADDYEHFGSDRHDHQDNPPQAPPLAPPHRGGLWHVCHNIATNPS